MCCVRSVLSPHVMPVCVCVFKYFKCCVLVNIWCTAAGTVYTVYTQYCCGEHGRHTGDREDNADNTAKSGIYLPGGAGMMASTRRQGDPSQLPRPCVRSSLVSVSVIVNISCAQDKRQET